MLISFLFSLHKSVILAHLYICIIRTMRNYDVVIIGAGVSGLFAALRLSSTKKRVLVLDAGHSLTERLLLLGEDIATHQTQARYLGFGGLGLSEGKYNYTNDFGGDLAQKIGAQQSINYQFQVDQLLCQFGAAQRPLYNTYNEELMQRAQQYGFKVLTTQTRHLGTSLSTSIFKKLAHQLNQKVEFQFNITTQDIEPNNNGILLQLSNGEIIQSRQVIIAVGNSGLPWLQTIAQQLELSYGETRLDLGFRIEMHNKQLQSLLANTFETKLLYQTKNFTGYTYCMNPSGRVIAKYQNGLVMPDGQNCYEVGESSNLNFTLFIPKWFKHHQIAHSYLQQTINHINQGQQPIACQRLHTIDARFKFKKHLIEPTLTKAEFANLASLTPDDYLQQTCDFLFALQSLIGEPIDGNTILYAMDSKSYAPIIQTNDDFATKVNGLYIIGDSSGVSCSLSQAAATGLYVADKIKESY